ncbi:MAG: peptidoglycan-associated lipoprotein Pal [Magnetococcales bacterium]|nr:peptidoglycan-associated lipoprotein Pal [Magnetococcales bacterium]
MDGSESTLGGPMGGPGSQDGSFAGGQQQPYDSSSTMGGQNQTALVGEPSHRVQFGFNSAMISDESRETLIQNAQWIRSQNYQEIIIEGHCDERGTRDYNLALGEKRANAVKQFLTSQGVDWYRIRTISYGKERPLDMGHHDGAWARNRRAEIILQ